MIRRRQRQAGGVVVARTGPAAKPRGRPRAGSTRYAARARPGATAPRPLLRAPAVVPLTATWAYHHLWNEKIYSFRTEGAARRVPRRCAFKLVGLSFVRGFKTIANHKNHCHLVLFCFLRFDYPCYDLIFCNRHMKDIKLPFHFPHYHKGSIASQQWKIQSQWVQIQSCRPHPDRNSPRSRRKWVLDDSDRTFESDRAPEK